MKIRLNLILLGILLISKLNGNMDFTLNPAPLFSIPSGNQILQIKNAIHFSGGPA